MAHHAYNNTEGLTYDATSLVDREFVQVMNGHIVEAARIHGWIAMAGWYEATAGSGFWIWRVKSMEEAIEWVKRCPNPMMSDSEIEIRPLFEMDDFGDAMTPELKAQEERLCAEAAKLAASQ